MALSNENDRPRNRRTAYRWWMGWRPLVVVTVSTFVGFAVGNAVAVPVGYYTGDLLGSWAALTSAGFFLGIAGWVWGTRLINERYEERLSRFLDESRNGAMQGTGVGSRTTDSDTEAVWTVTTGTGSTPLVEANKRYSVVHFVFGDQLSIFETGFDMTDRRGGAVRRVELPYDCIASVRSETNRPELTITTTDAETFRYETVSERADVLSELANAISETGS